MSSVCIDFGFSNVSSPPGFRALSFLDCYIPLEKMILVACPEGLMVSAIAYSSLPSAYSNHLASGEMSIFG